MSLILQWENISQLLTVEWGDQPNLQEAAEREEAGDPIAVMVATVSSDGQDEIVVVADIAARNALPAADYNQIVLVKDASADVTVDSGQALYIRDASDSSWTKISEQESIDVTVIDGSNF